MKSTLLQNKYIKEIMDKLHNPKPKSTLLPYRYYDSENNLFICEGGFLGFIFEIEPIVGVKDNLIKQLSLLFDEFLPEESCIQFLLIADSDINSITSSWLTNYTNEGEILQNLASTRVQYLETLTKTGSDAYRIKNYRVFVSYTKKLDYNKLNIQIISGFRQQIEGLFRSSDIYISTVDVNYFLELIGKIIAPDKLQAVYNKYEDLSGQIAKGSPIFVSDEKIKHSNYITKCYIPEQMPDEFGIDLMVNLLGDSMRDNLQIPGRFIISYTICNNISEKNQVMFRDKGQSALKQSSNLFSRFDLRIKKEAREWLEVEKLIPSGQKLLSTSFIVMLTASDAEFLKCEQHLLGLYTTIGFKIRSANYFMLPCFLASLPLGMNSNIFSLLKYFNLAKTTISSEVLGLLPIHAEWKGNSTSGLILAGRRGQLFTFSPYIGESNYNCCVIGQSGSGKSVLLQDLVVNLIASKTRVFVIDIGKSFEKLCKLIDGDFVEFKAGNNICINPFSRLDVKSREEEDDFLSLILPILAKMAAPKRGTTDIEDSILARVLQEVWKTYRENSDISKIAERLNEISNKEQNRVAGDLALLITRYSDSGNYGRFFSGEANVDFQKTFTVIEFESLRERQDLMAVIMQMLSVQIMTQVLQGDRKQRFAIIFDEAWFCLAEFPKLLANLARTIRKYNGALILGTQSVNDFFVNETAKSIMENSGWLLMLKQKKESIDLLTKAQKLSLDESQIALIKSLSVVPGKYSECLLSSSSGYVVGRLLLDPFSRILYSTSPKEFSAVEDLVKQGKSVLEAVKLVSDMVGGEHV